MLTQGGGKVKVPAEAGMIVAKMLIVSRTCSRWGCEMRIKNAQAK